MAKKKEGDLAPEENKEKTPSYEEVHNTDLREAVEEANKPLELDPNALDEEPEEKPEEKVEEKPQINTEQLKEELKSELTGELEQKLSQSTAQKVVEALSGEKKEEEEQYPWEKDGRTPSYKEALDYVKDKAKAEIMEELDSEIQKDEEAKKAEEDRLAQEQKVQYDFWDAQLASMVKDGLIPPMKDAKDENDPGRKVRIELFEAMKKADDESRAAGGPPVRDLFHVYYRFMKNKPSQPGKDAPVAGTSRGVAEDKGDSFSYAEMHNSSNQSWFGKALSYLNGNQS